MNIDDIMKKAKEMQEQLKASQDTIAQLEVTGESGAGMVKCHMKGDYSVLSIWLDPSLIAEGNKGMMEELISGAVNDAVRKVSSETKGKMGNMFGDLGLGK